jgi:hypothetical protein
MPFARERDDECELFDHVAMPAPAELYHRNKAGRAP